MLVPAQSDVPFDFFCNWDLQQPVVKAMTMAVVHPQTMMKRTKKSKSTQGLLGSSTEHAL